MPVYNHDPAVELAQAESICREQLPFTRDGEAVCWVMVEYDRRAAEIEQLRVQSATTLRNMLAAEDRELAAVREVDDLRHGLWQALDREPREDRDLVEAVRNLALFQEKHVTPMLAELEQLRRQRAAVLDLHRPEELVFAGGQKDLVCAHCTSGGDPYSTVSDVWPCPTASALGVEA